MWRTLLWFCAVVNSVLSLQCPNDFIQIKSKCYHFSNTKESWPNAHHVCEEKNSSLAILKSALQNEHLRQHMMWYRSQAEGWLGGIFDWQKKVWRWGSTGAIIKFQGFAFNNMTNLQWKCLTIDPSLDYRWNARLCYEKKHFICQKPVNRKNQNNLSDDPNSGKTSNNMGEISPGHFERKPSKPPKRFLRNLTCPKPFIKVRKNCYFFSTKTATWHQAIFICREEFNSSMAIVDSIKDDQSLLNNINRHFIPYTERWIGGRYDWIQKLWFWDESNERIPYISKQKNLEWHCLTWNPKLKTRPRWNSDICTNQKYFMCQTPIVHVYKVPKNLKGRKKLKKGDS